MSKQPRLFIAESRYDPPELSVRMVRGAEASLTKIDSTYFSSAFHNFVRDSRHTGAVWLNNFAPNRMTEAERVFLMNHLVEYCDCYRIIMVRMLRKYDATYLPLYRSHGFRRGIVPEGYLMREAINCL